MNMIYYINRKYNSFFLFIFLFILIMIIIIKKYLLEKSFYNFYDENFGMNGIDFDASICTYEKNDGSKYNITVNDLFDNRNEFDEFKNSIYIDNHGNDEVIIKPKSSSKSNYKITMINYTNYNLYLLSNIDYGEKLLNFNIVNNIIQVILKNPI